MKPDRRPFGTISQLLAESGAPPLVRMLEPWTVLALAVHALAVELVASAWSGTVIAAVALLTAMGAAGLLGWQSPAAVVARLGTVLTLAFILQALRGEGSGYFLLWLFVVEAVYPLVMPGRAGRVVAFVIPATYLVLVPLDAADGPLPVALVRAVSLVFIGLVVHAAVEAFRESVAERADALAMLDTFGDATPVGLAFWDRDLRFQRVNPTFAEMSGWPMQDLLGREVGEVPMPVPELLHHLQRVREGRQAPPLEVHCAGRWWTLQLFPMLGTQRQIGVGAVAVDITSQRESARALAHSATHDALTGLPNRALLRDRLEVAVARAARRGEPIAVLFLGLDRFKEVNDSLGHAAGDELLRVTADRLGRAVRDGDTVARLGGDEFAVLCAEIEDERAAVEVAERIRGFVRAPMRVGGRELSASMSIGVTVSVPAPEDAEQLLADADVAMYRAKDLGRDRVVVFDTSQRAGAQRRFEFHAALRSAVERHELTVAYQPIFDLDGRAVGVEALARWERGGNPVGPSVFVPIAEDLGLIVELGRQVMTRAAADVQRWRATLHPDLKLAVNVSPRQLAEADCVRRLAEALEASGLPATALQVEVTESAVMSDVRAAVERLEELRGLGVQIALDDFGTGYSSLAILRDLPVDVIKVDRSFTVRLPEDVQMVAFIVDLARAVGATTTVEGVETPEQLAALRPLGCDAVQGFLLGRPLPAEQLEALLSGRVEPTV